MASIRKRGDTFTITAYMGYDEQGKQRKKTTTYRPPDGVTAGKAEKLAKQYAAVWEEKIRGYVALDENRTFAELEKWYYETVAPSVLKPQTLKNYRGEIERHIMPVLGREKLKNITPPMLDSLFAELQKSGNVETHYRLKDKALLDGYKRQELADKAGIEKSTLYNVMRGTTSRKTAEKIAAAIGMPLDKAFDNVGSPALTGASVNKIKLNLSAIFTAAVKKEIMRRNPCKLATPPKVDTPPAAFFDEEQSRRLLDTLHEQPDFQFEVIGNLFLATGIRSGELCALHWDDIDFQTGVLYISHTMVRLDGKFVRDTPKTDESERRIVLPEYVLDLLKEHKHKQALERFKKADIWKVPEAVFTNLVGNYLIGSNLNVKLKKVCRQAGLPELHLHSLRHTHASLLINGDVAARVIADRLGHSTTKTTLDTYSHVFAASEARAMKAIDMALFRKAE
ncbi:MAG: tyrosine-type recombinase/integrase [Clostridiales bacterium]|nr:tyrosine-type recombinase/integrase [Clostridiales bacterium]